jgi:hypothetical protein
VAPGALAGAPRKPGQAAAALRPTQRDHPGLDGNDLRLAVVYRLVSQGVPQA